MTNREKMLECFQELQTQEEARKSASATARQNALGRAQEGVEWLLKSNVVKKAREKLLAYMGSKIPATGGGSEDKTLKVHNDEI